MQVKVSDLRILCEKLFSHLEKIGSGSVKISSDYYWNIPKESRYDKYEEPGDLDLGQLTDDWAELKKILEGKSEPIGYALIWMSSILRAIGEEVVG